jgi:Ca2+-binding EF-hand superfamily protein
MPSIRDVLGAAGGDAPAGGGTTPGAPSSSAATPRRLLPATRSNLVKFFKIMDANSDGALSVSEFVNACRDGVESTSAAASSLKRQLELFAAIDKDGSGEVDVDEFVAGAGALVDVVV